MYYLDGRISVAEHDAPSTSVGNPASLEKGGSKFVLVVFDSDRCQSEGVVPRSHGLWCSPPLQSPPACSHVLGSDTLAASRFYSQVVNDSA